jgi:tyrosinase
VADLTAQQKRDYVAAVLALKHTPSPYPQDRKNGLSWYDTFVHWHVMLADCSATDLNNHPRMLGHSGPMFLPWHREYVLLFEKALNAVSRRPVTVPYWDWSDPSSSDRGEVKAVFNDTFMGPDGNASDSYAVDEGPFTPTTWPLVVKNSHGADDTLTETTDHLTRKLGAPSALPTLDDLRGAFAATTYDSRPFDDSSDPATSFRNALEGFTPNIKGQPLSDTGCLPDGVTPPGTGTMGNINVVNGARLHNFVHTWVGGTFQAPVRTSSGVATKGTMSVNIASPNDPVFFLHHAQIDRLWAQWQSAHGTNTYVPSAEAAYPDNALHDQMYPFYLYGIHVTPADVLDIHELGYTYTRPSYDNLTAATAGAQSLLGLTSTNDWWCR